MSGIRIVTKSECPFCAMAKNWLKEHSFEYVEDLIDNEEERLAFYQTINGATEVVGELNTRRINSVTLMSLWNRPSVGGVTNHSPPPQQEDAASPSQLSESWITVRSLFRAPHRLLRIGAMFKRRSQLQS